MSRNQCKIAILLCPPVIHCAVLKLMPAITRIGVISFLRFIFTTLYRNYCLIQMGGLYFLFTGLNVRKRISMWNWTPLLFIGNKLFLSCVVSLSLIVRSC